MTEMDLSSVNLCSGLKLQDILMIPDSEKQHQEDIQALDDLVCQIMDEGEREKMIKELREDPGIQDILIPVSWYQS